MGQNNQKDALFFRFCTKIPLFSYPFLSKKRQFSKKHDVLIPKLCQKNFHSPKITVLSWHFLNFSLKTPRCHAPIWCKKTSILSAQYYISGVNKSIGCNFFPIFHAKINTLMLILCQKNVHSKNTLLSCHILSEKRQFSQKHDAFTPFCCFNFSKNHGKKNHHTNGIELMFPSIIFSIGEKWSRSRSNHHIHILSNSPALTHSTSGVRDSWSHCAVEATSSVRKQSRDFPN